MVITAGITLVDQMIPIDELPRRGGKISAGCREAMAGGGAANAAVIAAGLGAPTKLFTCLGEDDFGKQLTQTYQELGIDLRKQRCARTPISLVFVEPDGERTLITMRGGVEPDPYAFDDQIFAGENDIFFAQISSPEVRGSFLERVEGTRVLPGRHLQAELAKEREWDVVIASIDEMNRPSGTELRKCGCRLFVLTAGSDGGEWWSAGRWHHFKSPAVSQAEIVDTCGAGDAFAGGLLTGLEKGLGHAEAVDLGASQGAACVTRAGSWPAEGSLRPLLP